MLIGILAVMIVAVGIVALGVREGLAEAGPSAEGEEEPGGGERRPSGSRGVYLVGDVEDLARTGARLLLYNGACCVEWAAPAVVLLREGLPEVEVCTAPDGSRWRAVPPGGREGPWVLTRERSRASSAAQRRREAGGAA